MKLCLRCIEQESNLLHSVYQTDALPIELSMLVSLTWCVPLAREEGVEPSIACMSSEFSRLGEPDREEDEDGFFAGSILTVWWSP